MNRLAIRSLVLSSLLTLVASAAPALADVDSAPDAGARDANLTAIAFEHADYAGAYQVLRKGRYDDAIGQLEFGNDRISSLRVPQGLVVRLFEHFHFQGRFVDVRGDLPVVDSFWNDRTSSIIVYRANESTPRVREVVIFDDAGFTGNFRVFQSGLYDAPALGIGNDTLSSLLVPPGMVVRLYEHAGFNGASIDVRSDSTVPLEWNDRVSSLSVMEDFTR